MIPRRNTSPLETPPNFFLAASIASYSSGENFRADLWLCFRLVPSHLAVTKSIRLRYASAEVLKSSSFLYLSKISSCLSLKMTAYTEFLCIRSPFLNYAFSNSTDFVVGKILPVELLNFVLSAMAGVSTSEIKAYIRRLYVYPRWSSNKI